MVFQHGVVTIPKTMTPTRMTENLAVFDFALTEEMAQLDTFTLWSRPRKI